MRVNMQALSMASEARKRRSGGGPEGSHKCSDGQVHTEARAMPQINARRSNPYEGLSEASHRGSGGLALAPRKEGHTKVLAMRVAAGGYQC
jgi:hypothetical protein